MNVNSMNKKHSKNEGDPPILQSLANRNVQMRELHFRTIREYFNIFLLNLRPTVEKGNYRSPFNFQTF